MSFKLRPYQQKVIDDVRIEFSRLREEGLRHKRVIVVAPTGAGKTYISGEMVSETATRRVKVAGGGDRRGRAWFAVPFDPLVDQTIDSFCNVLGLKGLPTNLIGVIHPDYRKKNQFGPGKDFERPIQIVAQKTVYNRLKSGTLRPEHFPDLWIDDECHTTTWRTVARNIRKIVQPSYMVGLTGSPVRTDPYESFAQHFDAAVFAPSVNTLTDWGNLSPMKFFEVLRDSEVEAVVNSDGSIDDEKVKEVYTSPQAIAHMFKYYMDPEFGEGKKGIGFCLDVEHAKDCADYWNSQGVSAAYVDYTTPRKERLKIFQKFASGEIWCLFSRDVLAVGFDEPTAVVGICMRPTDSEGLWIQQIGRPRRSSPGKEYGIILDFTGNIRRHGDGTKEWIAYGDGESTFGILDPAPVKGDQGNYDNPFAMGCQNVECDQVVYWQTKVCPKCGTLQVREEKKPPPERHFGDRLIQTVRPSSLDESSEAHAIRLYRFYRARAVLGYGALPGKARFDMLATKFAGWDGRIPRGPSEWTVGAIFNNPSGIESAELFFAWLQKKYSQKVELSEAQRNAKIWYSMDLEFYKDVVNQVRANAGNLKLKAVQAQLEVATKKKPIKHVDSPFHVAKV